MRIRAFGWILLTGAGLLIATSCSKPSSSTTPFRPTATIRDIMESMIEPSADFIFDAVATTADRTGTHVKEPRTDEEWTAVHRSAITVIEATNLLVMEGRHVGRPGEAAEDPNVELGPEEIEKAINADRASFITLAHALHDAGTQALKAIDAKSAQALLNVGERIDEACENCHLKYWYPPSRQAETERRRR